MFHIVINYKGNKDTMGTANNEEATFGSMGVLCTVLVSDPIPTSMANEALSET